MRKLRQDTQKRGKKLKQKYNDRIKILEMKRNIEERKLEEEIPDELDYFSKCVIFDSNKFKAWN